MIHRWIHRRAVLAWLLLPWAALLLAFAGLAAVDVVLGDGVVLLDWRQRAQTERWRHVLTDLPLLMAGLHAIGTVPWGLGVLMGGRSARRASVVLGLLCALASLWCAWWFGLAWQQPASLVLALTAFVIGGLQAALTHRPLPALHRRRPPRVVGEAPPVPPPPPPPPPKPAATPIPTLMRHEPPTTQPAEY